MTSTTEWPINRLKWINQVAWITKLCFANIDHLPMVTEIIEKWFAVLIPKARKILSSVQLHAWHHWFTKCPHLTLTHVSSSYHFIFNLSLLISICSFYPFKLYLHSFSLSIILLFQYLYLSSLFAFFLFLFFLSHFCTTSPGKLPLKYKTLSTAKLNQTKR